MARKRSGGTGGRSKAYRMSGFRVTCEGCGKVERMPVRPPRDVQLYCIDCTNQNNRQREAGNTAAG